MMRTAVLTLVFLVFLGGSAAWAAQEWIQVVMWDGREVTLGDFGFYESFTWDHMTDYRVHRGEIPVAYYGAVTEFSLKQIASIQNSAPSFAEHFHGLTIELVDGTRFASAGLPEITGVIGRDTIGEIRIPGRMIRSIKFLRPTEQEKAEK